MDSSTLNGLARPASESTLAQNKMLVRDEQRETVKLKTCLRCKIKKQEAQLSLTNCATLFCKVVEVLQDFLSENVDKKFTTDYNVA